MDASLTPSRIVEALDQYIIGQHEAKRHVAIALRNRWRRLQAPLEQQADITPNNILLIGATGVGKTEIARRLAALADAPFVKVEASKFTEVGYVGRDVESMVRDLAEQSVQLVRQRRQQAVRVQAQEAVEQRILDALIPPVKKPTGFRASAPETDDASVEASTAEPISIPGTDADLNARTRERLRDKLRAGELDHRKIEIPVEQGGPTSIGMMLPPGIDEASMQGLQEMLGSMMPRGGTRTRKVSVAEARKLLLEEEAGKLIDMDEVKEEAIRHAENAGIIFIDEIDKVASSGRASGSGSGRGPDVSREGVQRDLLPIVEGSVVSTKYGPVRTDHILFIAAGAFHVAKPSDLIPELQGRFPIRVELQPLSEDDFYQILLTPKNALPRQYEALLQSENVTLTYDDDALRALAKVAFELNAEVENIGARRLQTVMSRLLSDILFDVPDRIGPNSRIQVTAELVRERLAGLVKKRDISEFIL
jgi:ATP-dependent HslUV protease ATP-binding subunit HslU